MRDAIVHFTCQNLYAVRHAFFAHRGGVSSGYFTSLNCSLPGDVPGRLYDDIENVLQNRTIVHRAFMRENMVKETPLIFLKQVHSAKVIVAEDQSAHGQEGDALVTTNPRLAMGLYTADCVPVLLCDVNHRVAAAIHVGWKGALSGIIHATIREIRRLGFVPEKLQAGIGPALQQMSYEVDYDFRDQFVNQNPAYADFFKEARVEGKLLFNLPKLVIYQLNQEGVSNIATCPYDTCSQPDLFFSHRRATRNKEPGFGSHASVISLGANAY